MPKLKQYKEIAPELMSWMSFFKKSENVSSPIEIKEIHDAYEEVRYTTGSDAYRNYVDALEKGDELIRNELYLAKKKSRAEGMKEGLAEGKKEGLAEGEKKGKHEKAIEAAKKMLSKGLDTETISECTGLSKDNIRMLY